MVGGLLAGEEDTGDWACPGKRVGNISSQAQASLRPDRETSRATLSGSIGNPGLGAAIPTHRETLISVLSDT